MNSKWEPNELDGSPQPIRPETHWLRQEMKLGRKGNDGKDGDGKEVKGKDGEGELWFSLQLKLPHARHLHNAFARKAPSDPFDKLIQDGALIAPSSHIALGFALDRGWTDPDWGTIGTDILVPPGAFAALERLAADKVIEITDAGLAIATDAELTQPKLTAASAKSVARNEEIRPGGAVIIAIIDDGIGIANHRFRKDQHHTRIEHLLDLALVDGAKPTGAVATLPPGHPQAPDDELLGRSWRAEQIDHFLPICEDEESVYRALGLIDPARVTRQPLRAAVTHGTHMLDTAAGFDWRKAKKAKEEANGSMHQELINRRIIAVQLPTQVAENRSDAWMPQSLKRALDWILVKADELSDADPDSVPDPNTGKKRRLPLIVNGSFASMAGPQDGGSDVERRISQFVDLYRGDSTDEGLCNVILSAGNSLQLRAAARLELGAAGSLGGSDSLFWRVQPDDKTASFVQIWLPRSADWNQQVAVTLKPPRGAPESPPSVRDKAIDWKIGERVCARLYHQRWWRPTDSQRPEGLRRPEGWRECITIAIGPTADDGEPVPLVPSGLWQIKVTNESASPGLRVDLRVHRDDVGMFARSGARQAYFDDPGYQPIDPVTGRPTPFSSPVTMQGTLNAYGYGRGAILVAGYRNRDHVQAPYSSSGDSHLVRNNDEDARGPDLAAVSEESAALPGVLGSGTVSGSVAILSGTSVAAPLVTRALADFLATGGAVRPLRDDYRKLRDEAQGNEAMLLNRAKAEKARDLGLRLGDGLLELASPVPSRLDPDAVPAVSGNAAGDSRDRAAEPPNPAAIPPDQRANPLDPAAVPPVPNSASA